MHMRHGRRGRNRADRAPARAWPDRAEGAAPAASRATQVPAAAEPPVALGPARSPRNTHRSFSGAAAVLPPNSSTRAPPSAVVAAALASSSRASDVLPSLPPSL